MPVRKEELGLSQDAAIVVALADTAVPFAMSPEDEAERWVRVLRLHGWVGSALQSLGVGEAPLETSSQPDSVRLLRRRPLGEDIVQMVTDSARSFAVARAAGAVCTVDVLFALFEVYGKAFDRALYLRGTTRDELIGRLPSDVEAGIASG
jgi:hypothetical protein